MRIPKELTIGGVVWKIELKDINGGSFSWHDHTISIGKDLTKQRKINTLVHEVCEVIMVNHTTRYQRCLSAVDNGDYMFIMDHNIFSIFSDELSGVLREIYA